MIKEFKCLENCSDCCGVIPIPKDTWEEFKHLSKESKCVEEMENEIWVIGIDMNCVFLDGHKCLIYDSRPNVCREYGLNELLPCPFIKSNGNKRSKAQTTRIVRQKARELKQFMEKFETKGVETK